MIVIYIKNAKKENCKILMHPKELEVNINLGVSEYVLDLDLCDDIIPSESRYTVLSTKIEINLKKKLDNQDGLPSRLLKLGLLNGTMSSMIQLPKKRNQKIGTK